MKARVKEIEVRNLTNRFPVDGVMFSEPSRIVDVMFTVRMMAKDFLVTKDLFRMGEEVHIYLTVKKKPKGKRAKVHGVTNMEDARRIARKYYAASMKTMKSVQTHVQNDVAEKRPAKVSNRKRKTG